MNKYILMSSLASVLIVSGFLVTNASAEQNNDCPQERIQKREMLNLEDRGQFNGKSFNVRFNNEEMVEKWKTMTFQEWKNEEINRINNVTEEQFEQMKKRMTEGSKLMIKRMQQKREAAE